MRPTSNTVMSSGCSTVRKCTDGRAVNSMTDPTSSSWLISGSPPHPSSRPPRARRAALAEHPRPGRGNHFACASGPGQLTLVVWTTHCPGTNLCQLLDHCAFSLSESAAPQSSRSLLARSSLVNHSPSTRSFVACFTLTPALRLDNVLSPTPTRYHSLIIVALSAIVCLLSPVAPRLSHASRATHARSVFQCL